MNVNSKYVPCVLWNSSSFRWTWFYACACRLFCCINLMKNVICSTLYDFHFISFYSGVVQWRSRHLKWCHFQISIVPVITKSRQTTSNTLAYSHKHLERSISTQISWTSLFSTVAYLFPSLLVRIRLPNASLIYPYSLLSWHLDALKAAPQINQAFNKSSHRPPYHSFICNFFGCIKMNNALLESYPQLICH